MAYFHGKTLVCSQTSEVLSLKSTLTHKTAGHAAGLLPG